MAQKQNKKFFFLYINLSNNLLESCKEINIYMADHIPIDFHLNLERNLFMKKKGYHKNSFLEPWHLLQESPPLQKVQISVLHLRSFVELLQSDSVYHEGFW